MKKVLTGLALTLCFGIAQAQPVLSVHCPLGCPQNPTGNLLFFGHVYALSLNPQTKLADWVAYQVDVLNFGESPGRNWKNNPSFSENTRLEEADYKGANSSVLQSDRGHQAPLASFAGNPYWYETNYLSNITPQDKDLNQGPWVDLESAVRDAVAFREPLWVITGPVYTDVVLQLPNSNETHRVPNGYFKIVYDESGGAVAFQMSQTVARSDNFCDFRISVSSVNSSGLGLVESQSLKSRLGC